MPTITESPVDALAHCIEPRCPGYAQESVPGRRVEESFTFVELNGTAEGAIPGFERSMVRIEFADEDNRPCPHCGGPRDITDQPRVSYQNLSGHDQMGLLKMRPGDVPDVGALQAEIQALKAKLGEDS
jgi:hypothetical protein